MEKVLVLTGSFNPPTKAHLAALTTAMDQIGATKGYFVPTSYNYVNLKMLAKEDNITISDDIRMAILREMAKEDCRIEVSDIELTGRTDSMKTYDTLCEISKENPECQVCYLAGADKLRSVKKWYKKEDFLTNIKIVVFNRDDINAEKLIESDGLLSSYKNSFIILDKLSSGSDISATKIRNLFRAGDKSYKELMTPAAAKIFSKFSPSDFPEITFESWVAAMKTSTKRHDKQKIFKRVYEENKELIKKSENIAMYTSYTKLYSEKIDIIGVNKSFNTKYRCVNEDVVSAAEELTHLGLDPAIQCTCSRKEPAEYYASGEDVNQLTESELCRISTLSQYLYRFGNAKKKCIKEAGVIAENKYPLDINYGAIYSPEVHFFRENFKKNYALREEPLEYSVINVPPLSFKSSNEMGELQYMAKDGKFTEEGFEIQKNKIRTVLRVAAMNGHDSVVFDDFGVRAGKLPIDEVARQFFEVFGEEEFRGIFKEIVFALSEGRRSSKYNYNEKSKYKEFYNRFGK